MIATDLVAACEGGTGTGCQTASQTHRYGCHDRPDYVARYTAPDGYVREWMTRVINITNIQTTAERDCQYTKSDLGKVDNACNGCNRKKRDTQ